MTTADPLMDPIASQLADAEAGWSVGTFGAIAEFTREPGEAFDMEQSRNGISAVTQKGGIRVVSHPDLRLIASESPTTESWSHRIALCLPHEASAMSGRTVLTELGPDVEALLTRDRSGILFDLGLGTLQIDACIRVSDADAVAALRSRTGQSVFAPESDAMRIILAANPHRVFISRIGRAEVFQRIPPPGGRSPDGPHTHVLPKLLTHRRTHAATEPLPEGWIPCAHLYPAHPLRDQLGRKRAFRPDHHAAFQALLELYGLPELTVCKRAVVEAVAKGRGPEMVTLPPDRTARATVRVALRQLAAMEPHTAALAAWLAAYDRRDPAETEDPMEALH
ncbi:hypothetical protein BjapCC829_25150 [Bradyrhizobium barranii]|uniref:Uncharacterized protein n=1 Tax=Bradyrhizobium barranii TaxID=2992140 RepID=A0ABY3QC96_9BRAD|nr:MULTISPECIES: hypothetical protein [Bradyrhizobium]UFW83259.1 hypothetical protein BjapCC829_25150 [Bradyrhizobium japonicum]CUU18280.1 COG3313 Predicted FeS protein CDS [Bradyrhizobium sp.]